MKQIVTLAAAMVLLIGTAATPAMGADATASMDVVSAYVWRGQTFNDGVVLQPSIDAAAENGLGFNVWGNYDTEDYNNSLDSGEFSEIDLTISYSKSFDSLDLGVGVIEYLFPATDADDDGVGENALATTELYISLAYALPANLSVGLDIYYDIDALDGFSYATLSISYAYDITDKIGLEAGASMGYAGEDFSKAGGGKDSGLYDYTLSLSLGYAITDALSASAGLTYVDALDDDNLKEVENGGLLDTNAYYSVGVAYAF